MKLRKVIVIASLFLLVFVAIRCTGHSEPWLDLKKKLDSQRRLAWQKELDLQKGKLQIQIEESFLKNEPSYTAFKQLMCDYSLGEKLFHYYDSEYLELSPEMIQKAEVFIQEIGVPFSDLYIGGMTELVYPENACVFRCTLWMDEEVYCWVDLVYSEHWDHPVNSEVEIALTPEWRIITFWGF